jgi:hypothetical protein
MGYSKNELRGALVIILGLQTGLVSQDPWSFSGKKGARMGKQQNNK